MYSSYQTNLVVDCKWSKWSECSTTCGLGKQYREKEVKAKFGGRPCLGSRIQSCNKNVKCFGELYLCFAL